MKNLIRLSLISVILLACGSAYAVQISFGIAIGPPPPPRVVHVIPRRPGPDFLWIEGYWQPVENHYRWHDGYWVRPPFAGGFWVSPRYDGRSYYNGYWERGNRWTSRDRDYDRYYDRGRDRDRNRNRNRDRSNDRDRDRGNRGNNSDRWSYRN